MDKDRRASLLFVYARPFRSEKQPRELVSRVEFLSAVICFRLVPRFNYKKEGRNTRSFPRIHRLLVIEKRGEVDGTF